MKALSIYAVLVALALKQATAVALPEPESPVIQNTKFGPDYSDVASNQRCGNGDATYHPVDKNTLGIVDSNIAPSTSTCSDANTLFELTTATTYMEKNGLGNEHEKRNGAALEKRDWRACVRCMATCGLNQQALNRLSIAQQIQHCLGNCVVQGACTPHFRAKYGDQYGNSFPVLNGPGAK